MQVDVERHGFLVQELEGHTAAEDNVERSQACTWRAGRAGGVFTHGSQLKFDSEKVVRKVKEDRFESIDSCLVRIMKARTELTQKILIAESMNQLSNLFKVDRRAIKKRIDVLIDGEYFERDEEDPNLLMYLA